MQSEMQFWRRVAEELQIDIVTPFEVSLSDGIVLRVAALVKSFGARNGMLVMKDFGILAPHTGKIADLGYGFSSNIGASIDDYDRESMIEVLRDWTWTGPRDQEPKWLSKA